MDSYVEKVCSFSCLPGVYFIFAVDSHVKNVQCPWLEWAFFSPVARPTSKPGDVRPPIGEAAVVAAQGLVPSLDVYALGGVSPASAARLAAGGVRGVAVLGGLFPSGALTTAAQAEAAARPYLKALDGAAAASCDEPDPQR